MASNGGNGTNQQAALSAVEQLVAELLSLRNRSGSLVIGAGGVISLVALALIYIFGDAGTRGAVIQWIGATGLSSFLSLAAVTFSHNNAAAGVVSTAIQSGQLPTSPTAPAAIAASNGNGNGKLPVSEPAPGQDAG